MFEVICITFAFFFGLAVRQAGLPPLVGFLGAGFAINAIGPSLNLPTETGAILDHIAHLGVLMLLFTVGLKLKLRQIAQPHVLGGALAHFALSVAVYAPGLRFALGLEWDVAFLLGSALAFSSTVLAAKILESKRELAAFHGRVAIGILVVQDIIALAVLAIWGGHSPSVWAVGLVVLPLLRPLLHWLLDFAGHDELMVLMGMLLALVVGGMGFEAVGLSPEIGALVMGLMLSGHRRAQELSESLWSLKEVFLVGFFLQIGMSGLPGMEALVFAGVFALLLPLKGLVFFLLLAALRLRARSAFLSALSLTAYSEFGLIIAAGVVPEWLVPLAVALALSFMISAPLNRLAHPLFERLEGVLDRFESKRRHPDEVPADLGSAQVLILGMGRTGSAAYDTMRARGAEVIGVDSDTYQVAAQRQAGRNVIFTDVEDANFWRGADLSSVRAVILALDDLEAKLISARALRKRRFTGPIVTHALYQDHLDSVLSAGATHTYLTMEQAGNGLAEQAALAMGADAERQGDA